MVVLTSTRPLDTAAAAAACWGVREPVCGAALGGAPGTTPGGALGGAVGLGNVGRMVGGVDGRADAEGLGAATAGSSVERRAPTSATPPARRTAARTAATTASPRRLGGGGPTGGCGGGGSCRSQDGAYPPTVSGRAHSSDVHGSGRPHGGPPELDQSR